jgi:hypothetical protein
VVYQKPSERFLKDNIIKQSLSVEKKYYSKGRWAKKINERAKLAELEKSEKLGADGEKKEDKPEKTVASLDDLLDFGGPHI